MNLAIAGVRVDRGWFWVIFEAIVALLEARYGTLPVRDSIASCLFILFGLFKGEGLEFTVTKRKDVLKGCN